MYPLEWFDSLIINTFESHSTSIDVISAYETEVLRERITSESKKIKIQIKESFFELKTKRQIRLLIRKYHSSFIFLLDRIIEIKKNEKFSAPEFLKVFDFIVSSLDDLLSFLETRYPAFISLDQRVPFSYYAVWKSEITIALNNFNKKKAKIGEHDFEIEFLVNLLRVPLQDSRKVKSTYRQILYYRELLIELEKLNYLVPDSACFSELDLLLIRMNFNSREYAERLLTKAGIFLNSFESLSERLENIFHCCRQLANLNSDLKLTFNPSQQHLISFLENWFSNEIRYIEKKTAVLLQEQNGISAGSEFVEKADSKLECILSGDQIGLILRATDEARIIKAKSMNYIFKSIVPYLSTPVKRNLSYQSVRSKSYNAEDRDKEIAIESLEKIIRKIKTY